MVERVLSTEFVKFARRLASEWGNGDFHEARPSRTKNSGLKYCAQQEVLQYLIAEGRIHRSF